jgi:hypothetical protein
VAQDATDILDASNNDTSSIHTSPSTPLPSQDATNSLETSNNATIAAMKEALSENLSDEGLESVNEWLSGMQVCSHRPAPPPRPRPTK